MIAITDKFFFSKFFLLASLVTVISLYAVPAAGISSPNDSTSTGSAESRIRPWTLGIPLWVPGYHGQFTVGGVEIDGESEGENIFDRLFSSELGLDFYLVGLVNYQWNPRKFHLDVFSGTIKKSTKFTLTDNTVAETTIQLIMPRFFVGHDFLHDSDPLGPITYWQVYAGGRLYFLNLEVALPRNWGTLESDKTWFTFLIGTELSVKIFRRVQLLLSGDIGGFSGLNKLTSFGQVTLNYRPWDLFSVNIGYAALYIGRELDNPYDIQFEANLSGPTLGVGFHF